MKSAKRSVAVAAGLVALASTVFAPLPATAGGEITEYTVVAADDVSSGEAVAAIVGAGGQVVASNDDVGMFTVNAPADGFTARVAASPKLTGAAARHPIGHAPGRKLDPVERAAAAGASSSAGAGADAGGAGKRPPAVGMDPLDGKLWGLEVVRADRARRVNAGDRRVTVGVLDTGLDASNPDLEPNFSADLSRNFAPDRPDIDGPCEVASCLDPVGTDDQGHGTHVAGTIAAAANGFGLSGVAPNVTLVELKGGQDSGYFFLESVVNALTYAGRAGLDVVNMSFYVDPWRFNCTANPADSPAAQAEQRTITTAMFRALTYAHLHGVTLVGSLGNAHEDLGAPQVDTSSPNYPADAAYPRKIDNRSCVDLPVEGPFVIGVSALGPSLRKADYSNYGTEQISVSAPGGWFRDGLGTPSYRTDANEILSTYPKKILQEEGRVDQDGNVVPAFANAVFKECTSGDRCGYYAYLQGTSMAAPHVTGVAALIVSKYGHPDPYRYGRLRMAPWRVEARLVGTAAEHACPVPRLHSYTAEGRGPEFDAYCDGDARFNGFYGHGIVDAYAALTAHGWF